MAQVNRYLNLTSSGIVIPGEGVLAGFYVNSTSGGIIKFWSSPTTNTNLGGPISGYITPAIGYHNLGNLHSTAGVYMGKPTGTIDVTLHIKESD